MKLLARIFILAFLATLWVISVPLAVSQNSIEPTGALKTHRFKLENYRRRYKLYTPANATKLKGPRPLVLVIHGGGSSDNGMVKLDKKRWQELADQHGFYVAYPNAVDRLWDFGGGLISGKLKNRVDDLAYFHTVIDKISARNNIDSSRIFATGISRGGQASYYLACNMPDRIRAVMPITMSVPKFMEDDCVSGPPVGIAVINGTADPIVPYDGGWIVLRRSKQKRDIVLSTDETIALWRKRNGCMNTATQTQFIDTSGDKTSVNISTWSRCSGAPVKLYKVNKGGHTWPSGIQYLPTRIVGETSNDINASDEGWDFFSHF